VGLNFEDRVKAVAESGFTERQARFLTTVMLHAGVCVPRQYARFAGIAYGHKVSRFFDGLVHRGYVTASQCRHNRAQLYHVRHHALYSAIGQPDSRYRRPVSGRLAIERIMILDGVVTSPELMWLGDEAEKVAFFALMAPSLPRERLPHVTSGRGLSQRVRLFPAQLPIGVETTGRVVFLYLVTTPFADQFRGFVRRHSDLLRTLSGWTLRLLFAPNAEGMITSFETVARDELTIRFAPQTVAELKWYFEQCRDTADHRARSRSDERFWHAQKAFATSRWQEMYRLWLTDGDRVFELVSSTIIADTLTRGTARIESHVLPVSYRHLSPLGHLKRTLVQGVEKGDRASARPQPPPPTPLSISDDLTRDWYRLVGRG
jgi:hypothetical protein